MRMRQWYRHRTANHVSLCISAHSQDDTHTTSHVGIGVRSVKVVQRHTVSLTGTSSRSRVYHNYQHISKPTNLETYLWGSIPSQDQDGSARMG